jgi:hypothetical protein
MARRKAPAPASEQTLNEGQDTSFGKKIVRASKSGRPTDQRRQSWRDVLPIHPAAELFPLMSSDELRELGEDIRANKLQFPIATWFDPEAKVELLTDGRNRLDAMELVGLPTAEVISCRSRLPCIDPWDFTALRDKFVALSTPTTHDAAPADDGSIPPFLRRAPPGGTP